MTSQFSPCLFTSPSNLSSSTSVQCIRVPDPPHVPATALGLSAMVLAVARDGDFRFCPTLATSRAVVRDGDFPFCSLLSCSTLSLHLHLGKNFWSEKSRWSEVSIKTFPRGGNRPWPQSPSIYTPSNSGISEFGSSTWSNKNYFNRWYSADSFGTWERINIGLQIMKINRLIYVTSPFIFICVFLFWSFIFYCCFIRWFFIHCFVDWKKKLLLLKKIIK